MRVAQKIMKTTPIQHLKNRALEFGIDWSTFLLEKMRQQKCEKSPEAKHHGDPQPTKTPLPNVQPPPRDTGFIAGLFSGKPMVRKP